MAAKKELNKFMMKALHNVGEYYTDSVREQLIIDGLQSSGELAASIDYDIVDGSLDILNAKYGGAIDEGSSPARQQGKISRAMLKNIMDWANMKGIKPEKGTMRDMAWAIAKTVKKKGIIQRYGNQGAKIYDRVYSELEERIGADLMEGYQLDIKEKLNKL